MHSNAFALVLVMPAVLAACSEKPPPPPPASRPAVFDPQLKAIEAAKSVEGTLKEQDEARRRLVDGDAKP